MRLRRLRRRFALTGPRLAVRRAMPWPLRWLAAALVLGLSAAVALWAFEFGKSLAGLDAGARQELKYLRTESRDLHAQISRMKEGAIAAESLRVTERAAMDTLAERLRQLEADNRSLRDDLAFFEKLIPASSGKGAAMDIRGLQAELMGGGVQLRWQVLVIQPMRNAPEFKGQLELLLAGLRDGKPWTSDPPAVARPLQLQQYRRVEGVVQVPERAVVKTVTVRLTQEGSVRALQTVNLE
ncbi:MAG: hypothetical protein ABS45_02600 [Comamonas sp. SCN 65-56]|uniref:DUF6776 family protein n=1 Tax=Comamonas sp. SCN 65-56 TaxID=1660095 RepID=UPI00086B27D2|nr:DUF6776 family protein [Comamonas sp. SCN 65-56]ODS93381.1 MAG: hypothetical protein ABS45_02600 [Comamonas sp. SCN 65-56]